MVTDASLEELTNVMRKNILKLFKSPRYSSTPKNTETGIDKLLQASNLLVGSLTNNCSHGQNQPLKLSEDDVISLQGYIILLINTILHHKK